MGWLNYLNYQIQNLRLELVLLLSVLGWLAVRLFGVVGKRQERGKLKIRILGKDVFEIKESSNSEVKRTGRGI